MKIAPKTKVKSKEVVMQLTGLSEGEVIEIQTKKLSDLIAQEFVDPKDIIIVDFKMANINLSEYQVRCAWGIDAKNLVAQITPFETNKTLDQRTSTPTKMLISEHPQLENISYSSVAIDCPTKPCDIIYTVSGNIVNDTEKKLKSLSNLGK